MLRTCGFCLACCLGPLVLVGSAPAQETKVADARFGTLNPLAPPETEHWGRLAGVWDCRITTPLEDGTLRRSSATWTWRYILDGHAVQDVYVGSGTGDAPPFRGTGLRIYHPESDRWEISWAANSKPVNGRSRITLFTAKSDPDRVVMSRGDDPDWVTEFYDITGETFSWRSEPSGQRMSCARSTGR